MRENVGPGELSNQQGVNLAFWRLVADFANPAKTAGSIGVVLGQIGSRSVRLSRQKRTVTVRNTPEHSDLRRRVMQNAVGLKLLDPLQEREMPHRLRFFIVLVLFQSACLVGGLLMYERFLLAVTPNATAAQTETAAAPTAAAGSDQIFLRCMTFVWITGLQATFAWLLLGRLYGAQTLERNQSQETALAQSRELVRTRDAVIFGLAKLAESRDPETGHHLERISMYATRLATACRRHPRFKDLVSPSFVQNIGISSALHDIGKVGIEDAVLLKPGRLTDAEYARMQVHPQIGGECIEQIQARLGESGFLKMAKEIALYHHEWWEGSGYPNGLRGDQIPLAARIVAICDVYDALSTKRVYKDAYPHALCVDKIQRAAGTQFDPMLVDVFLAVSGQFQEIAERLRSADDDNRVISARRIAAFRREEADGPTLTPEQERILAELMEPSHSEREAVASHA
jgi:HD-GYP domain-containing protein (c-di-GMP phosphodiesterase class II)